MKKFSFTKLSGAGNDFILFDRDENPGLAVTPGFVQNICRRRVNIGADGVLVIRNAEENDFEMEYYNSDGSTGSLCGNGARCAIKYAWISGRLKDKKAKFIWKKINYSGEILESGYVRFNLNSLGIINLNTKITAAGQNITASFADTGSPHVVVNVRDVLRNPLESNSAYTELQNFPVYEIGREIRFLPDFAPAGTNVNFIDIADKKIEIRTYERGVEEETLACGTGSVAAAVIGYLKYGLTPPINLTTKSGEILTVDFTAVEGKITHLSLTGPAVVSFTGELSI